MFVLDFTKPYMYANTIAFYQGNLSTNNTLRCKLKTGSVEDLTGYACTATFYVNGVEIVETCKIIDRASCIVDVVLPSNALVAGEHKMEVILTKPNVSTIQSPMLKYEVWQGLTTGEGIEGTAEYPVLVELINNTQQAIDKTNELQTEVKASLVLANEEIEKIPGKVQQKVDEITSNIDPLIQDIEKNEEIRQANEAERIKEEDIRKANEKARIDAELVREHNDADHEKAEAVRETNEENRRVAEEGRVEAEKLRVKAESDRVVAEDKRVQAENKRQENYDFMTGDEERRRLEENKRIEAEKVRVASETDRIAEENKRRTVETSRVKAEETRVSSENTRIANEETRKTQETQRVQAETDRTTKYDKLVQDTNASIEEFNTFATQAKTDETTRKRNETNRVNAERERRDAETAREASESVRNRQEDIRVARDENREQVFNGKVRTMDAKIAEGTAKISEVNTAKNTMVNDTKQAIDKMKKDFSALTASQQQDAEVILARDGEESLNARLKRDLEKGKLVVETLEGAHISCNDTVDGIIKDIEVFGNTVQSPSNLSDIKSVGIDNGDGTYNVNVVSCGKNLANLEIEKGRYSPTTGEKWKDDVYLRSVDMIKCSHLQGKQVQFSFKYKGSLKTTVHFTQFDKNRKFIRDTYQANGNYTIPNDVAYVAFSLYVYLQEGQPQLVDITDIQLEEGVKVTPFEECKQSKCTIKLPCQLEKVGDIADRLYFDKVENAWCIEKNIFIKSTRELNYKACGNTVLENTYRLANVLGVENDARNDMYGYKRSMCSRFPFMQHDYWTRDEEHYYLDPNDGAVVFFINKSECGERKEDVIKYMQDIDAKLYLVYKEPKKIVLPLDVQIQLNQFLGTTNVWLECGEVDGTIKATFSKSISATTVSNTKAIDSLETRVKNIEGLKESQDIIYDSKYMLDYNGCIIAKETNTGTIKDIKLSGKSIKNVCTKRDFTIEGDGAGLTQDKGVLTEPIPNGIEYTVIVKVPSDLPNKNCFFSGYDKSGSGKVNIFDGNELYNNRGNVLIKKATNALLYDTPLADVRLFTNATTGTFKLNDVMIIIGDYTQNPPTAHFEGISSVGNGVDEIEVSSVKSGGNLFNLEKAVIDSSNTYGCIKVQNENEDIYLSLIDKDSSVDISGIHFGITGNGKNAEDGHLWQIEHGKITSNKVTKPYNFVSFHPNTRETLDKLVKRFDIMVNKGTSPMPYQPYIQDKKTILFKDTDGTWKPVTELRGLDTVCDTIELHSDGKYYYHQRTSKMTLNELSEINLCSNMQVEGYLTVQMTIGDYVKSMGIGTIMSEKYKVGIDKAELSEGIYCKDNYLGYSTIAIRILNSKANTVEAFKQYLQTNNDTLIYQLAKEKIFEVNPLFLDAFEGETLIQVLSGTINADIELKITSYISGLITANTRRIKELENEIYKEQEAQNQVILENDMRIIDLEIALMDAIPTLNIRLGGEDVQERSQLYFDFLKGRIESGNYTDEYLERVINKYLQGKRITQDEYDVLYDMIYPPVYDLPQE